MDAVLIAGPTASGKSALALEIATRRGGVVINADSMQVYRDLRIITARPTPGEEARAPHRLYGEVDGAENFSVGKWLSRVEGELARAREAGRLPVITGGTGLYFKALIEGLSEIPPVPESAREKVRAAAETASTGQLHARLAACDPATAVRLRATDRQRILRALEVWEATGRSLASFHGARQAPVLDPAGCVGLFLALDRGELRSRIDRRFDAMLAAGALAEVRTLAARGLDPALPIMRAHGVPGLIAHLNGQASLTAAVEKAKADTRAYARRQETWFRHQLPGFARVPPEFGLAWLDEAARTGVGPRAPPPTK